jgi:hypothetical protein
MDPQKFNFIFLATLDKPTIVETIHWLTADKSSLWIRPGCIFL